ncbi:MAG: T9SS type A sorting domain-containing protein [Candidatus Cloacimonetes bacterium]|nr:T9SS type A sorting domain-containing protein [Candidatus Cloacimonadota bacterium]
MIDPQQLNFGQVPVGESEEQQIMIINLGNAPMSGEIQTSSPFWVAPYPSGERTRNVTYSVQPSETAVFSVTFIPLQEGNFIADLIVTSNDLFHQANTLPAHGWTETIDNEDNTIAFEDMLFGNSPNPFNPETTIRFSVKNNNTPVTLDIYNIRGQRVTQLANDVYCRGNHKIIWNGKNNNNKSSASGVYFYRMRIGRQKFIRKMLLLQ